MKIIINTFFRYGCGFGMSLSNISDPMSALALNSANAEFSHVGGLMLSLNYTPVKYDEAVDACSEIGSRLVKIPDIGTLDQVN